MSENISQIAKSQVKAPNLSTEVSIAGITLDNPVIPASGTFGFGYEFADFYDINVLGSIALKGTTREERYGNPLPRIAECTEGLINSVGLQNPGVDRVISEELPKLKKCFSKLAIANVSGFSIDDYVYAAKKLDAEEQIGLLEINVSCPNVHNGGMSFGTDPKSAYAVAKAVKDATTKPVFMKLTPNVTSVADIARACADGGADGISLINTLLGMRINLKTRRPVIANKAGGFSGRAILPVAVRMVYEVYDAVKLPIIGMGGIASAEDVIEFMLAGATAVEVGAQNLVNPYACKDIIEQLPETMQKLRITKLSDIIGGAHA